MRPIRYMFLLLSLFIFFNANCQVKNSKHLNGVYVGDKTGERIELLPNNKYILLAPEGSLSDKVWNRDTISYGNWSFEQNLLVLNSSPKILGKVLPIIVKESEIENYDSIKVFITNPFEKELPKTIITLDNKAFYNARPFYYVVFLNSTYSTVTIKSDTLGGGKIITYPSKKMPQISNISLMIVPDCLNYPGDYLAYKLVYTTIYKTKNETANYFKISIPSFTDRYLNYMRMKGVYVKIVNNRNLKWNNETFVREK